MTRPALVVAAVAALAIGACRGEKREPAAAAQRYTFRAEVVKLPDPKTPVPQIVLRHERVPDFRDRSGAVVGMDAMTMPFDLAPDARLDGISPGEKVVAVLAVDWSRPSFRIERLTKLPAGTTLDFGGAASR